METTSVDQPTVEPPKVKRRLAGSYDIVEQDEAKRLKRRAWRARERRLRKMRLVVGVGLAVIAGVGVLAWRDLGRKHFEASEPLKYIGIQYELQRVEILRYAPFHDRHERLLSRTLDRAMGELSSADLGARVIALQEIRNILGPRKTRALQTLARDYPQMKESFEINLEDSDVAINELNTQYVKTVKSYNAAAGSPAAMVVRRIIGLPDKLPSLKK